MFTTIAITVIAIVIAAALYFVTCAYAHSYITNDTTFKYLVNSFRAFTLKNDSVETLINALNFLTDANIVMCDGYALYTVGKEEEIKKALASTKWHGLFKLTFTSLSVDGKMGLLFIERKYKEFIIVPLADKVKKYRALRYSTKSPAEVVKEFVWERYNQDIFTVKNYYGEEVLKADDYNKAYLVKLLNRLNKTDLNQFFHIIVDDDEMWVYKREEVPSFLRYLLSR